MPSGQLVFVVSLIGSWRVELTAGRAPRLCNFGQQRRSYGGAIAARPCSFGKTNGPKTNADRSVDLNVGQMLRASGLRAWLHAVVGHCIGADTVRSCAAPRDLGRLQDRAEDFAESA